MNFIQTSSLFAYSDAGHIAVDASGNVYVNHNLHSTILRVTPDGQADVVAGDGGFLLDSTFGPLSVAIYDMVFGDDGVLYLAFGGNVSRLDPDSGTFTRVAGTTQAPFPARFAGDGGPALGATLNVMGLAAGGGSIFLADSPVIRRLYVP